MKFILLQAAQEELDQAMAWYDEQRPGLGSELAVEVRQSIGRAMASPEMYPLVSKSMRRCSVHRFPYSVIYGTEPDLLIVAAIMHTHRKPDYWVDRLE